MVSETEYMKLIGRELKGCFEYFWNETNPVNGITRDGDIPGKENFGSISATGYALAAYVVGLEEGFVSFNQVYERVIATMRAAEKFDRLNGFYYHFLNLSDGKRYRKCEASIMDTALLLAGMAVCAEYFGGEVREIFDRIYAEVNWKWLYNESTDRFYMGFDERQGGIIPYEWNHYAEQFLMYFFGVSAPNPDFRVPPSIFYSFDRWIADYDGYKYIRSGPNALFVYQFSHAFIDFRGTRDKEGVDWFENSVNATLAHRKYCINNEENSKTYSPVSWGLSACHFKHGYSGGFGAKPYGDPGAEKTYNTNDGTVAPYSAVSSITFTPKESLEALEHFYGIPELLGKYGLKESYNLDETPPYYDPYCIGIDKGITILQLSNYKNGLIWKYFMRNEHIQKAMGIIGIEKA